MGAPSDQNDKLEFEQLSEPLRKNRSGSKYIRGRNVLLLAAVTATAAAFTLLASACVGTSDTDRAFFLFTDHVKHDQSDQQDEYAKYDIIR